VRPGTISLRETAAFVTCAVVYWLEVFPRARRQREHWRSRAEAIPDPVLRRDALLTIEEKWGHSEGAAAFAVLVPRSARGAFVRMAIAYELMIDFLDTTSERPVSDPWANTLRLHGAAQTAVALAPKREPDHYMFHSHHRDGGFLSALVGACREIFETLPSSPVVAARVELLAAQYGEAQAHCHVEEAGDATSGPTERIDAAAARHPELAREEVVAGCTSSVAVLALMALATREDRSQAETTSCHSAYFPETAALHILLHSLVDEVGDRAAGNYNQLGCYRSKPRAAEALASIASRARGRLAELPQASTHLVLFGGMVGYYLADPAVWQGENRQVAKAVLGAVGPSARWAMLIHRGRFRLAQVAARARIRRIRDGGDMGLPEGA